MGFILTFFSLWCAAAWAILPLPYPVEPWDEDHIGPPSPKIDISTIEGFAELHSGSQTREMELPVFNNPGGTLGYDEDVTFVTPPALRKRVDFWKKIYTRYTSTQALLHDPEDLTIHYRTVDISKIENDPSLSERRKRRKIHRLLKAEKKKIKRILRSLHHLQNKPLRIPISYFPIFSQFEHINDRQKFLKASKRIRSQIGQRDRIVRGFFYGGRYFPKIMQILEDAKVPKELSRLTLVESAFDLNAISKVGASGVWQFMPTTARRYMFVNRAVDERNDPITAAYAAAKLLSENFKSLESWPLAITAYNHGKEGMRRAVRTLATKDLPTIIEKYESRTFGFASSNFYASFLAILEIEKDYRRHFGKLRVDSPLVYSEFPILRHVTVNEIVKECDVEEAKIFELNPALTKFVRSGQGYVPKSYQLKVPPDKLERCRQEH